MEKYIKLMNGEIIEEKKIGYLHGEKVLIPSFQREYA
jgi:hypothetical protein